MTSRPALQPNVRLAALLVGAWLPVLLGAPARAATGLAVLQQLIDEEDGVESLGSPDGLAVSSPDGAFVYVAAGSSAAVHVLARDALTGTLALASATVDPLTLKGVNGIALSPDGAHAYVSSSGGLVTTFARDGLTGALTPLDVVATTGRALDVVVSPDGATVYVANGGGDAIDVFDRAVDGTLTPVQVVEDGVGGVDGLEGVRRLAVSPDGLHLYGAAEGDESVTAFARDPFTGELTFLQQYANDPSDALRRASDLALTADGAHLYVAAGLAGVTVFARDALTGLLTFVEAPGPGDPFGDFTKSLQSVAVSADGTHVVAASSNTIVLYDRDAGTGSLTFVGAEAQRGERVRLSPDGANAYAVDSDVSVTAFRFYDTACAPAPLPGCKSTLLPGKSLVQLKYGSVPSSDRVAWKWKGQATALAELGDPVSGLDDVIVCLYDQSGGAQPVFHTIAPAGGTCAGKPCWKVRGTTYPKLKYKDPGRRPDGLLGLDVKQGPDGKASVKVKGKDRFLVLPVLPLTPPVRVQLQAATGACWEGVFSTVQRNDPEQYKAKSD